jgi:hypothetical protein
VAELHVNLHADLLRRMETEHPRGILGGVQAVGDHGKPLSAVADSETRWNSLNPGCIKRLDEFHYRDFLRRVRMYFCATA